MPVTRASTGSVTTAALASSYTKAKDTGPTNISSQLQEKTVLYLAYGSNLSTETFRGRRNVRPLSAVNVVVPALELVFDLPGLPYTEPCFANTRFRPGHNSGNCAQGKGVFLDVAPLDSSQQTATALGWTKGLVGVVYEVTPEDYAHIIATEGGGNAYADILIECFPLSSGSDSVPKSPEGGSFKAHTLFAGASTGGGIRKRRDGWAQASKRYLNLITTGAEENDLPGEYRLWLDQLRPFQATTGRQQIGRGIFTATWIPWLLLLFQLQAMLSDDDGVSPEWLGVLVERLFYLVWLSYDTVYKPVFGEGERTIGDEPANLRKSIPEVV